MHGCWGVFHQPFELIIDSYIHIYICCIRLYKNAGPQSRIHTSYSYEGSACVDKEYNGKLKKGQNMHVIPRPPFKILPALQAGDVVILKHHRAEHAAQCAQAVEEAGCTYTLDHGVCSLPSVTARNTGWLQQLRCGRCCHRRRAH